MNRLQALEKLVNSGSDDPFARYGLAMEYRRLERPQDALRVFTELREKSPEYLAMYLMAGQLLLERGQLVDAKVWLEQGLVVAQRQGNSKAVGELEAALAETA